MFHHVVIVKLHQILMLHQDIVLIVIKYHIVMSKFNSFSSFLNNSIIYK